MHYMAIQMQLYVRRNQFVIMTTPYQHTHRLLKINFYTLAIQTLQIYRSFGRGSSAAR